MAVLLCTTAFETDPVLLSRRHEPIGLQGMCLLTRRFALTCIWFMILAAGTPARVPAAHAQDSMRIAAVVNEDAISVLDVRERTDLIFATTGLSDTPETRRRIMPQVLRTLIDETLELQEAKRQGFDLELVNLGFAYSIVEQNLGLTAGQLPKFLQYNKLSQESLDRQLSAEIAWNELVTRRMRTDEVSEEDVDEEMLRIEATANEPAYLLAEMFLAVDEPEREAEVEANMRRLRDAVISGASFPQLARQFSQAASAADGGDLGWIAQSQLGDELAPAVMDLQAGSLSEPIRVIGGYSMILLRERRQGMEIDPKDARIVMRQTVLPLGSPPAMVREVGAALKSCSDFDALQAARPDLLVSAAITIRLGELQPHFLEAMSDLAPGTLAKPIESNQGIHLVMICERMEPESPLATREEVRANLENVQFDLIARGYLRDLRRQAFVDVRI